MVDLLARLQAALGHRYTIERELGRGGMATVYLAADLKHHRRVAIKVLKPELAAALGPDRFLREIETAARLNHPHILPLHDSGQAGGSLYYVMPYIEGESLRDRLEREGPLPVEDALRITREVAGALSYAHSHDVVHRDIKPENILLSGGEAVVADFGIARAITQAAGSKLTETGIPIGTPAYMSPEQASGGGPIDGRSDVYSLACVLYEMLVGEPPYTGPSAQVVIAKRFTDPVPSVRRLRETVPPALDATVSRALAKEPADRFVSAARFADALTPSAAPSVRPWFSRRRILLAGAITAATAALVVTVLRWRAGPGRALDANLIAVAPFEVLDPKLDLWREGMVDLLSRQLDGAGALRTVPPSIVLRRWSGPSDAASATEVARRTGARLAVFGALVGSGTDSVQLTATLFDAGARTPVGEIKLRSSTTRMDGLVDSLAVHLLGELARVRPVVAVRRASLGSISLPALKAFLEGERFYRQANTDSALAYYQRSVELDSSFCLGWRRLGQVTEWSTFSGDSLARVYLLRAGRLNHGLPPRESLLVASESLFEALYEMQEPFWFEYRNRLFTTLEAAARLFPNDPEVWYELGEAREHWPLGGRNVSEHALEGFSRAIALDSSFTPGYFHTAELGLWQGGPAEARHYLAAYLAHAAPLVSARGDPWASGMALTYKLLDSDATPAQREFWISSASDAALFGALNALPASRDSAETEVRVARAFAGHHPTGNDSWERSRRLWLAFSLARRGHLREAYAAGGADPEVVWRLAPYSLRLRGPAADSTAAFFGRLLRARPLPYGALYTAAGWWSVRRDSTSLRSLSRRMDQALEASKKKSAVYHYALYGATSTNAYLALARGDTAEAVRTLLALPDSVCWWSQCAFDRLTTGELLAGTGKWREAAALFERPLPAALYWGRLEGLWWLERARVWERLGRRDDAACEYGYVVDVWRNADEELQPYVAEARAALARLNAEPRR